MSTYIRNWLRNVSESKASNVREHSFSSEVRVGIQTSSAYISMIEFSFDKPFKECHLAFTPDTDNSYTVRARYITVYFLLRIYEKKTPIAHPLRRGMGVFREILEGPKFTLI